jgi:hypothetical protein
MSKKKAVAIVLAAALATIALLYDPELYVVVLVHVSAIPAFLYPLIYNQMPWRSGPTGRALMNKALSVALLFGLGILGFWWVFPGYEYIYAVVVTYLGVAITYQFLVMNDLRRRGLALRADELRPEEGRPR